MRVALVAPETVHHRSSPATRRIDEVARLLSERGHDVTVLCARWWEGDGVDEFEKDGVDYRALSGSVDATRSFAVSLPVALRRTSPDVIHVHAARPGAVLAANYGTKLARAPLVAEWYDTDPTAGKGPKAVSAADRLVAPSRLVHTWLREAGADKDDIEVVPDAVDYDAVRSTDPDDRYRDDVVYARRLDEDANLESLLLALAELRGYDWTATIVGEGPERERYESQTEDLRIDDRVRFVGELDREERIGAYRAARAFVQTARRCVFPTELLWALSCGCVGIVEYQAHSSAHELVENRDRCFRTTSETELTEAIREAGGFEHREVDDAYREYDQDPVLERYLACYRELRGE